MNVKQMFFSVFSMGNWGVPKMLKNLIFFILQVSYKLPIKFLRNRVNTVSNVKLEDILVYASLKG